MATRILTRIVPLCLLLAMLWIAARAEDIPKIGGAWFDQSGHEFTMHQDGLQVTLRTRRGRELTGSLSGTGNASFQVFHMLTYEETSSHLPPKVRQKIVADGRRVSIYGTVSADAQTITGEYRDEEIDWEVESGEYTATYTPLPHPITLSRMCDNGKTREPEKPTKKTKTWQLPDPDGEISIKMINTGGHGEYAVKGSEKALGTVSDIIKKIAKVVDKIPGTDIMKIPMKYFEKVSEIGGQITEAGKSISEKTAKAIDLDVEIPVINRTVTCVQTEICRDGQWKPDKMKESTPQNRQDKKSTIKLPHAEALTVEEVGEYFNKHVKTIQATLNKNKQAFDADPCEGVESEKPVPPPATKEKTECDKLREALGKIDSKRKRVQQEIETAKSGLADVNKWWKNHIEGWRKDLVTAKGALDSKQSELKKAESRVKNTESNMDSIVKNLGQKSYDDILKEAKERVARADQAVRAATQARDGIQRKIDDQRAAIQKYDEKLKKSEYGLRLIDAEEARLKKELEKCP